MAGDPSTLHNCLKPSVLGSEQTKGEAKKLEYHYPHTLKVKYRESLHQSS